MRDRVIHETMLNLTKVITAMCQKREIQEPGITLACKNKKDTD